MRIKKITECIAFTILISSTNTLPAATLTQFTLSPGVAGVSSGTFSIGSNTLTNLSQLTGDGFTFNYAAQLFTPSTTGSYTFGMSSSPTDTVLILYQGAYDSTAPGTNAIALNDDSDGLGAGGVAMGTCSEASFLCPKMTQNLTASTDYYVVITSYSAGAAVSLPVDFFVYGDPVGVGGEPPPPMTSVLNSARLQNNVPAYGAAAVIDATPGLLSLFSGTGAEVSRAASQTLPLLTGGSQIAVSNTLSGINRIIQARIESNRGLSSGDDFLGDKSFWMKPFGSWADQNDRNRTSGFDAKTWGLALGMDGSLSSTTRLGMAFAYANSNIESNSTGAPQSSDMRVYQLIGYGSHSLDANTEVNFQIDAGQNKNKGIRHITFASAVASASYDSWTAHAGVGVARTLPLNDRTEFIPSLRADYTWIRDESYNETGAGALNLSVNSRHTDQLILGVDGKIVHQLNNSTNLNASLGVGYDTLSDQASITAAFAGAPGASFVTYGIDPSPWLVRAGLGLSTYNRNGMEVTARYDAEYRNDLLNHTASIKFLWAL